MQSFSSNQLAEMESRFRAAFINSLGGFKSLVLVGTSDADGQSNLAVFNSLVHIGANPPLCGLIFRPDSVERHTLSNIESTGIYTINHVHEGIFKAAHQTAARYPKTQSEFEAVGLTPLYMNGIQAPFVEESRVKFAVRFQEKMPITLNGTFLIIGQIMEIWIPEGILQADGFLDLEATGTLTCSGLDSYHRTERIARLSYAKPGKAPEEIPVLSAL